MRPLSLARPVPDPLAPVAGRGDGTREPVRGVNVTSVGYVLTNYPRVSQTFIAGEMQELASRGIHVVPFSLNAPDGADLSTEQARVEERRTVYVKQVTPWRALRAIAPLLVRHPGGTTRVAARALRSAGWDLRGLLWRVFHLVEAILVRDHCRRNGIGHLHAQFGQATATIAWLAHELDAEVGDGRLTWSFTIHGFQDFVNENQARLDLKARSASFVVCVSDFTRSQLMRLTQPEDWSRFHIVRCGIDFSKFQFAPRPALGRPPVILLVARLSAEKGHYVLLDALAELRRAGSDATVEFVGDGEQREAIAAHAVRVGVADAVRFLGELQPADVAVRLAHADVFCLPSFAEGLPVSIMEAMASGVPVVTTYVSGIPELAVDDETAMVVPAGNSTRLAHAIAALIDDPARRARLTANALERVREAHDIHANVADLAALFAEVGVDR